MAACKLADFDIIVRGEKSPYTVIAGYDGANESGSFVPDILAPEWQQAYRTLAHSLNTPDAAAILTIGASLWDALMQGRVRDLWVATRSDVEHGHVQGLRLRLDLQASQVAALPWESLYDPIRNVNFAAHPHFCLVRVGSLYSHVGPKRRPKVQLPLHILIAAPEDPSGVIDSKREIAEIRQIMAGLGSNLVQVDELTGRFSITELRNEIAKVKPTVLHFSGHGDLNGLQMWSHGKVTVVPAQSLRSVMERSPSVQLLFLNSCLSGRSARLRPFTGIAEEVLQAGVAAVIAMQYQVRDDVAIDFAHFLYGELLGGSCPGIIDLAMNSARSSLFALNPGDFSFGAPLLWLNRKNGDLFSFDPKAGQESRRAALVLPLPAIMPTLNVDEEGGWIDEMVANTTLDHLSGELAFLRSKWANHVDELRSLLLQVNALTGHPDQNAYREKVADYRRFKAALLRTKRLIEDAAAHS